MSKRRMGHRRNSVEDWPNNRFVKRESSRTQARNPRGHVVILRVPPKTTPFFPKTSSIHHSLVHNSIEMKRFETLDDNQSSLSRFLLFLFLFINKYSKLDNDDHPRMEGIIVEWMNDDRLTSSIRSSIEFISLHLTIIIRIPLHFSSINRVRSTHFSYESTRYYSVNRHVLHESYVTRIFYSRSLQLKRHGAQFLRPNVVREEVNGRSNEGNVSEAKYISLTPHKQPGLAASAGAPTVNTRRWLIAH